ncbi:MAG: tRNA pseudouridine(38-40) synthase TruA [Candidatus Coproplasma sp.]
MRYVLKVAYDGTDFCGWQVQPNGRTVQEELNTAVFKAFGESACVNASGRTDSGVHALSQVCHVDLSRHIEGAKIADALNFYLPQDVSVLASAKASEGFDSNRSAKKKTYCYSVYCSRCRNPLKDRYSVHLKVAPDLEKLKECASLFVGEHDFAAYCAAGSQVKTTVRTVYSFSVEEVDGEIKFTVCGNGFLYNMVRTLVGTCIFYACGKLDKERVLLSLSTGNRALVGKTMPPEGLCLIDVDYGAELFG